jgi:hypothetical protein
VQAEVDRAELSPERVELIDEVVDGYQSLEGREDALAAEAKKVAAGKVDAKVHERNVAAFETDKQELYEATDELRAATGHDSPEAVSSLDPGEDGSASGCGVSGAFAECGSVSKDESGERQSDGCMALAGVSGCGVSTGSGDNTASASCDLAGCTSNASKGENTASAKCTFGSGGCSERSRADSDGAEAECGTGGGSCDSSSSGAKLTTDHPTRLAFTGDDSRRGSATAHCEGSSGCGTSSEVEIDRSGVARADAGVVCGAGCSGDAATNAQAASEAAAQQVAGARTPRAVSNGSASCSVSGGSCAAHSGSAADEDTNDSAGDAEASVRVDCGGPGCTGKGATATGGTASGVQAGTERSSSGSATCEANGGDCTAQSGTELDGSVETVLADTPAAGGSGRPGVNGSGWTGPADSTQMVTLTDTEGAASSSAEASVDCEGRAACSGKAGIATSGKVVAPNPTAGGSAAVRQTSGSATCAASGGGCDVQSSSEAVDNGVPVSSTTSRNAADGTPVAAPVGHELSASSEAGAKVHCDSATCTGSGMSTTSGAASGDIVGVRDSTGSSSCTARGAGASCAAEADTIVSDRTPQAAETGGVAPVSGPVSMSNAAATVECSGAATECGGTTTSSTSARDTAVSPHARGSSANADCTVTGGGCSGETSSKASSAPDYVTIDPATGLPVPGQATSGPSSTSSSSAALDCSTGCVGSVRTVSSSWDGAVVGGVPRTSTGTASCSGGTGGCEVRSVSTASTGPGAAHALSTQSQTGQAQPFNVARMVPGPSAASAAGAALTCEGQEVCTGKVTSAATATDPSVSPDPRGSHSEGSCEGVSGGVCQAVTNSAASSGPDANSIAPLVAERSTANATITSGTVGEQAPEQQPGEPGQDQPPATPAAPTAPGSSANTGGPTVPGASSWTMAGATLDCAGSTACSGTARSSASGSDGPQTVNAGNGARGPPEGTSSTSASCASGQSGCRAQSSSTAASGQVVADIVAEQQNDAAEQAQQQATEAEQLAAQAAKVAARAGATAEQKQAAADAATAAQEARTAATEAAELAARPVENAPAALAQSSAAAQCAGPDCAARTTGATSGLAGDSHAEASCVAADGGCAVTSDAAATLMRDAGQTQGKNPQPIPGLSGSGQTSSTITCPEAGCVGVVTGSVNATTEQDGRRSASTATGSTGCDGTSACQAQITAAASVSMTAPDADEATRFVTTSAQVAALCDNGSEAGCATRTSSSSETVAADGVRGKSTTTCETAGACMAATGGFAAPNVTEVSASCAGTGCSTHTEGTAEAAAAAAGGRGMNRASSSTDCTASANGQCAGASQVGATEAGAQVSATCQGSDGSTCRQSIAASSAAESRTTTRTGGNTATANAACGATGGSGSGWCATNAAAQTSGEHAMAAASCQGSSGVGCSYSYRAHSAASARRAFGTSTGYGAGGVGGGMVMTTATASGGGNAAQASASCTGSPGTHCSHYYEATASASASHRSGSWARAYAHGSGGGGMGGGGVAVTASAHAEEGYANASASCSGAANCAASYSAHAEAYDELDTPYGKYVAEKWATCSGSGSGGCGAWAVAIAGPDGVADAGCVGDGGCDVGGRGLDFIAKEIDTGGQGIFVDEHGNPIDIKDVGPDHAAIRVSPGQNGEVVIEFKPRGTDQIITRTCRAPCVQPYGGMIGGNDRGQNNEYGDYYAGMPVEGGEPGSEHRVRGQDGVGIAQDAKGNAEAWARGKGEAIDGRTGDRIVFTRRTQAESGLNNVAAVRGDASGGPRLGPTTRTWRPTRRSAGSKRSWPPCPHGRRPGPPPRS